MRIRVLLALYCWFHLLLLASATAEADTEADAPAPCSTDEEKQFTVKISTSDPLGLRLSGKLEVLEFVADAQGRSRAIEASGLAEIGDRLIQVNDASLLESSLADAVAVLTSASLPKVLRFQTHDGRCMAPRPISKAAAVIGPRGDSRALHAESSDDQAEGLGEDEEEKEAAIYDYLLVSLGEKDSEMTFFGVLSTEGKPPSCIFREVEVAFPYDACSPLSTNSTNKYVVVPSMSGCPAHQKAVFVQDAGAKGVIFIQHEGKKPQQIKLPAELPKPIVLPLVMVTRDSGMQIVNQIGKVHPTQTLRIRFVFSEECTSDKFQVHPDEDPHQQSVQARIPFQPQTRVLLSLPQLPRHAGHVGRAESPAQVLDGHTVGVLCVHASGRRDLRRPRVPQERQFAATAAAAAGSSGTRYSVRDCVDEFAQVHAAEPKAEGPNSAHPSRVHGREPLRHHWSDLAELENPKNWPSSGIGRDRLFHRVLKDHATVSDQDAQLQLARYETLISFYWNAQRFDYSDTGGEVE